MPFTKLTRLIILNITLLAAIIISLNYDRQTTTLDNSLLALGDTNLIDQIQIDKHKIVKLNSQDWYIDNMNYRVDASKRRNLLRLLKKLKIKRPLSKSISDSLVSIGRRAPNSQKAGILVASFSRQEQINSFRILNHRGEDILIKDGKAYSIYVPGYSVSIFDYLNFDTNDLRERRLFQTSWKTLKTLRLQRPAEKNNLTIQFGKSFYEVSGVSKLDTLKLYHYLKRVEYLRVENFISDPLLVDSLKQLPPLFKLFVEDIRYPIPVELQVYQKEHGYLGISNNIDDVLTFKNQDIEKISVHSRYFEKRN